MISKKTRQQGLERQIRTINRRLARLRQRSDRFSRQRLNIFLVSLGLAVGLHWFGEWLTWSVIGLFLIVFNIVAYFHRRIERAIQRHEIFLQIKSTQLARLNIDWQRIPAPTISPEHAEHPFEVDLDITGKHSLHQLLDTAISREGSQRLRDWLLQTVPQPAQIQQRQQRIRELTPLVRFRDKLQLAFTLVSKEELEGEKLQKWLEQASDWKSLKGLLMIMTALAALNVTLFVLNFLGLIQPFWIISVFIYVSIYLMNLKNLDHVFDETFDLEHDLNRFRIILKYLENYSFRRQPELARLCHPFQNPQNRPSTQLARLRRVVIAISLRMNYLTQLILNGIAPWDFYAAHRALQARRRLSGSLPVWLDLWYELDALIALANFAYLNPNYTFPDFEVGNDQVTFAVRQMGHPLIPENEKICNSFGLDHPGEIALITGSNMSGKSTFLRTLGINLCLAYGGAPVNAQMFKTSLYRLFTCIKINDSVTGGFSYFYAEVRRLRVLMEQLALEDSYPVFYLIDEIFKGTNNRERLIGSRSYIRALVHRNGLGAISTHDLELTHLADSIPGLKNYHFREEVQNGKMSFDYKLYPGPCPTTNALKIMKIEGLPVEE